MLFVVCLWKCNVYLTNQKKLFMLCGAYLIDFPIWFLCLCCFAINTYQMNGIEWVHIVNLYLSPLKIWRYKWMSVENSGRIERVKWVSVMLTSKKIWDCLSVKEVAKVKRLSYFGPLHRIWLPKRMSVAVIAFNQRVGRRRRRFIAKGDLSIWNVTRNKRERKWQMEVFMNCINLY